MAPEVRWREALTVALLAAVVFNFLFGIDALIPTHAAWLLQGDSAQHYLGWQFFRQEPWQWPPGRISDYGYPLGTTIVFTDSIPLLALLLKPFSSLLPPDFQYFGAWILACYVLTGYFGLRLLASHTVHPGLRIVGASFFILSPPLLLRGYGHESLMAQWLVLASFDTYFRGWSARRWLFFSAIAALCHPYLLLMVLGIMAASGLSSLWVGDALNRKVVMFQGIGIGVALLAVMGLAGHFSGHGPLQAEGYGYFSMNLLSLIDPLLEWSRYIRQRPIPPNYAALGNFGQYEGFLYLGAGMILLVVVALTLMLAKPQAVPRRWWPVIAVALTFWVLALSNVVTLAEVQLFVVPLPDPLLSSLSIFRASGRLGWPAFYLISLGAVLVIIRYLPGRSALGVLTVALALQLADQADKYHEFRGLIRQRMAWRTPLHSSQWATLAQQANQLILVPPLTDGVGAYIPFAQLAAQHHLTTNAANIAHGGTQAGADYGAAVSKKLQNSQYDPHALYIFIRPEATESLPSSLQNKLITLDGYRLLPPGVSMQPS